MRARHERGPCRAPDRSNPLPSPAPPTDSRGHGPALRRGRGKSLAGESLLTIPGSYRPTPKSSRVPRISLESCVRDRTVATVTVCCGRRRRYPVLPHLACFLSLLTLLNDFRFSCALGSHLQVCLSVLTSLSLQQNILSVDIWLPILPLSRGFVSSSPWSLLLNEKAPVLVR